MLEADTCEKYTNSIVTLVSSIDTFNVCWQKWKRFEYTLWITK